MNARLICTSALSVCLASAANAADLHVPSQFETIQAALDAARPGDVVIVADGVYLGEGNCDLTFDGKAITLRSANGPAFTTIDCNATPDKPARGVHFGSGEGADSVLDGFTIMNGATPPGAIADQFNGAAILVNNGSSPTIRNCVLTDNHAGCWGGAVCCTNASPVIENCRIVNNLVDDDGGGVFTWGNSLPVIKDTLIAGNTAAITGGGFTNFGAGATLINVTIVDNTAWSGGGAYAWGATILNSIIRDNETIGSGDQLIGSEVRYSNIEGGFEGEGNVDLDPLFVDPENGDYHLSADSPSLDAGDPAFVPETGQTDIDGHPRMMGSRVDMGADERPTPDLNGDGAVNSADLAELLGNWGPCSMCPADLNMDGVVNSADLAILLGNWQ